jgi:tetratricopeptide (TPR) repeat protein
MNVHSATFVAVLLAACALTASAAAQSTETQRHSKMCGSGDGVPELEISACTEEIQFQIDNYSVEVRAVAYINRGNAYARKGQHDLAIADFDQAVRLNPNDAGLYYNRGRAYAKKGLADSAISDYDHAIRIDPNNAALYFARGFAYESKKRYEQAISDYDRVINFNPYNPVPYYTRGLAKQKKGDFAGAMADFNRAKQLFR